MTVIEFAEKRLNESCLNDDDEAVLYWRAYLDGARAQKEELFDRANADGDKELQAKLRNDFAEWIEVVRCQDCKYCTDISLVLPIGRKVYTCMEGTHDHQMLLSPNDFCSRGERRENHNITQYKDKTKILRAVLKRKELESDG